MDLLKTHQYPSSAKSSFLLLSFSDLHSSRRVHTPKLRARSATFIQLLKPCSFFVFFDSKTFSIQTRTNNKKQSICGTMSVHSDLSSPIPPVVGLLRGDWTPPTSLLGTRNTAREPLALVLLLALMVCLWGAATLAVKRWLGPTYTASYASRVISLAHAALSTAYCVYTMSLRFMQFTSASLFMRNVACLPEPPLADEQFAAILTASYFLYDTIGLFVGDYFDVLFLVHHAGALAVLGTALLGQRMGLEIALGIVILECTNVQMHGRWLLLEGNAGGKDRAHTHDDGLHLQTVAEGGAVVNESLSSAVGVDLAPILKQKYPSSSSWLWWACDDGFLITFAVVRLFLGTAATASFYMCPSAPAVLTLVLSGFLIFSARFFVGCLRARASGQLWIS